MRSRRQTKYQPVGLPVSPSLECEVTTKRTLGSSGMIGDVQLISSISFAVII